MKRLSLIILFFAVLVSSYAQNDSIKPKLTFEADFRFRIEQDWNSKKSDGTLRDDRTRLRYRVRAGANYENKWYRTGFRIRTGDPTKQQDPQLTLGSGAEEFGTLEIGIENAYFQGHWDSFNFWVGKYGFSFEKNNELFWSDNVYPEGVFLEKAFQFHSGFVDFLNISGGHFIMSTVGKALGDDTYFQGIQTHLAFSKKRFELFPSYYVFKNIPDIPDGGNTFVMDYSIVHIGSRFKLLNDAPLKLELDWYSNLSDYDDNTDIPDNLKQETSGYVLGLKYGAFKQANDWLFEATYANLERYAAVDFMAQNDWARWDYSSSGSPDGRLTNFKGVELVVGYKLDKQISLKMKYYIVEQLVAYGIANENGNRLRLDLDVKF